MKRVLHIGLHRLEIDGDLMHWEAHGALDVDDLRKIIAIGEELSARYGRYYSLIDARQGITVTPAARRYSAEWERSHRGPRAFTVIFGANPVLRALVTLLNRATELVLGRAPEVVFVKSEPEARAVITQDRARRAART